MVSHLWLFSQCFSVVNPYTLSYDTHSRALPLTFLCLMVFDTERNSGTVASFHRGLDKDKRQKWMKTKLKLKQNKWVRQMPKEMQISTGKYPYARVPWCYCIRWQIEAVSFQDDKWRLFLKCLGEWEKSNSQTKKNVWVCLFQGRKEKEINEDLRPVWIESLLMLLNNVQRLITLDFKS